MAESIHINKILSQLRQLDNSARLSILQRLAELIKRDTSRREKGSLLPLRKNSADIWKGIDPDSYVNSQREWD